MVRRGEVHAMMGPNGSGQEHFGPGPRRAGRIPNYRRWKVECLGRNLLEMVPEERAREGVFLAFQYPIEIPGVNSTYLLLEAALNDVRKHKGLIRLDAVDFLSLVSEKMKFVGS